MNDESMSLLKILTATFRQSTDKSVKVTESAFNFLHMASHMQPEEIGHVFSNSRICLQPAAGFLE